jgi:hypothetical protein
MIAALAANKIVTEESLVANERIRIGVTFCRVIRIHAFLQLKLFTIFGYQQKAGGPPALVKIASCKIMSDQ